MPRIQIKISRHSKEQENATRNEEINESIKTNSDVTQMIEFAGKDFKRYYNCIPYIGKGKQTWKMLKRSNGTLRGETHNV